MSLYDKASLIQIPSGYKAGTLYSVIPNSGAGDFTVTGDPEGEATRVNSQGLIENVSANVPRLDYMSGEVQDCPHLLLEPQRTNSLTYSEDFSQWTSAIGTLSTNNIISPIGSVSGALYTKTESSNEGYVFRDLTVSSVGTYTASVFFKYNNTQYVHFLLWDGSSNGVRCYYDIQNGNVGSAFGFGTTFSASDLKIEDYGNGWYRCSAKFTISGSDVAWQFRVSPSGGNGGANSNSGDKFYFFGAQVEQGSYPTSYIPTSGLSVTRLKDECVDAGNSSIFSNTTGTIFLDFEAFTPENDFGRLLSLSDQSTNNRLLLIPKTNNKLRFFMVVNGSTDVDTDQTISYNTRQKIAISYQLNSVKIYINGTLVSTDTSVATFSNLTKISFADIDNNPTATAKIYELTYFDSVISQSDLETLTTL